MTERPLPPGNPDAVAAALEGRWPLILLLDYDGTLAPLVRDPQAARMAPRAEQVLARARSTKDMWISILSGRSLDDLSTRVPQGGRLILAGNHGLELTAHHDGLRALAQQKGFRLHGRRLVHPAAEVARELLDRFVAGFAQQVRHELPQVALELRSAPGVASQATPPGGTAPAPEIPPPAGVLLVEHKGLTVSVHLRRLDPGLREPAAALVETAWPGAGLVKRRGHAVIELRPATGWGKGECALMILEALAGPRWMHTAAVVAVGDDSTDEDMFARLPAPALTARIAPQGTPTAARLRVDDVEGGLSLIADVVERFGGCAGPGRPSGPDPGAANPGS